MNKTIFTTVFGEYYRGDLVKMLAQTDETFLQRPSSKDKPSNPNMLFAYLTYREPQLIMVAKMDTQVIGSRDYNLILAVTSENKGFNNEMYTYFSRAFGESRLMLPHPQEALLISKMGKFFRQCKEYNGLEGIGIER